MTLPSSQETVKLTYLRFNEILEAVGHVAAVDFAFDTRTTAVNNIRPTCIIEFLWVGRLNRVFDCHCVDK